MGMGAANVTLDLRGLSTLPQTPEQWETQLRPLKIALGRAWGK
jgi:hypothetical protein